MSAAALEQRVTDQLFEKLEQSRFLHVPVMNRLEQRLHARDNHERYVRILMAKLEHMDYRSEGLLDRLDGAVKRLERAERREENTG